MPVSNVPTVQAAQDMWPSRRRTRRRHHAQTVPPAAVPPATSCEKRRRVHARCAITDAQHPHSVCTCANVWQAGVRGCALGRLCFAAALLVRLVRHAVADGDRRGAVIPE